LRAPRPAAWPTHLHQLGEKVGKAELPSHCAK